MPNLSSERVQVLRSWAKKSFTGGWYLDIGSAGADDPFLLRALRQDLSENSTLVGVDVNIKGMKQPDWPENLHLTGGDLYCLPYPDGSFDGCVFAEVLEHLYDPLSALNEIARVLRPGGTLLVSTPNPLAGGRAWNSWYFNNEPGEINNLWLSIGNRPGDQREVGVAHIQFFDPLSLSNILVDAGFQITELRSTNPSWPSFPRTMLLRWLIVRLFVWWAHKNVIAQRIGVYTVIQAVR